MSGSIKVPTGSRIETAISAPDDVSIIVLPPNLKSLAEIFSRPGFSAMLTHDEGTAWPDAVGCELANAAFLRGGAVIFAFESAADANACRGRLELIQSEARS